MPSTPDNKAGSGQNSRIVRVRDLPIYYDTKHDDIHRYTPRVADEQPKPISSPTNNQPSWLYSSISETRQSVQQLWNDNKELRSRVARFIETGGAHTKATIDYIRDDETFFPKVGVVTIAGLGGLLLGHKGGPLRKTFYSTIAATVALSACYPKQSASLLDQVIVRVRNESKYLLDKTTPNPSSLPATIEKKFNENKDRILHAAKNEQDRIIVVKGDYGQGTPADQHLYTTRGPVHATSLDAEKKI